VPLEHCDRCGCRESYLGSYGNWHPPLTQMFPPQQSASMVQKSPSSRHVKQLVRLQIPLQHSLSASQEENCERHEAQISKRLSQISLQHSVSSVQKLSFGKHMGVVDVEVVLVEVVVVGVVVVVEVVLVGVVVEVLVVLLVDVLVEVVLVEVVVVVSHGPRRSPWPRWPLTALLGTSLVCSAGVPGLWQMVTFCC
jgi:hypothetical protein